MEKYDVKLNHIEETLREFGDKFLPIHVLFEVNTRETRDQVIRLFEMYQFLYQIDPEYRFVFHCDGSNNEDMSKLVVDVHVYGPKQGDGWVTTYTGHLKTYTFTVERRGAFFEEVA